MKFSEAMALLEQGEKVRPVTAEPGHYIHLVDGDVRSVSDNLVRMSSDCAQIRWERYEEPGHDFVWALEQLKAGEKVKRRSWGNYISMRPVYGPQPFRLNHSQRDTAYELGSLDMIATDWELA